MTSLKKRLPATETRAVIQAMYGNAAFIEGGTTSRHYTTTATISPTTAQTQSIGAMVSIMVEQETRSETRQQVGR